MKEDRTKKPGATTRPKNAVLRRRQKRLLELFGKVEWDATYDYKAERTRR